MNSKENIQGKERTGKGKESGNERKRIGERKV